MNSSLDTKGDPRRARVSHLTGVQHTTVYTAHLGPRRVLLLVTSSKILLLSWNKIQTLLPGFLPSAPSSCLPNPSLTTLQPRWPPGCFSEKRSLFPSLLLLFLPGMFSAVPLMSGSFLILSWNVTFSGRPDFSGCP